MFILSTVVLVVATELLKRRPHDPQRAEGGLHATTSRIRRRSPALAAAARRRLQLRRSERAPKELNLFAWSEYVPQAVIDGFTKETGIQVNYETYASNEEMLAKLVSGAQQATT